MWSPGVYAKEQTDLADSPSRYNLTVKDLLLSGSSGDLVSSPHLPPGASELGGALGLMGPQYTHFENWKTVRQGLVLVPGLLIQSNPEN